MGALPHVAFTSSGLDFAIMGALGYDATALGNHEFDFGPAPLASAITAAAAAGSIPKFLSANIRFDATSTADDTLAAHYSTTVSDSAAIHPYQVISTSNGLKVGLIGYVGADAANVAPNKTPVLFSGDASEESATDAVLTKLYADLQPHVDTLRNTEQVDIVIGLSHSGMGHYSSAEEQAKAEDYKICQNVTGLDVVISGHSHNSDATPIAVTQADGATCLILNAGARGAYLGRIDLRVAQGTSRAHQYDAATQSLLTVDDTIIPDANMATAVSGYLATIESAGGSGTSYLEDLLSRVEGTAVTNDTATTGDLYFRKLCQTTFDVTDYQLLNYLSADAMLTAADTLGTHTDMALESAGVVRNGIKAGKTGDIVVTDAFNVVPLGSSPTDGTMGYPLMRANVNMFELRAVFEFSATLGITSDDYRLGQAGIKVTFDKSRPPVEELIDLGKADHGWVMKIEVDRDHSDGFDQYETLLYDRATGFEATGLVSIVTSTYIAQFASSVGVSLKDDAGEKTTITASILKRQDQTEVKQLEAFMSFLKGLSGGTLPDIYDASSANKADRQPCTAGCN